MGKVSYDPKKGYVVEKTTENNTGKAIEAVVQLVAALGACSLMVWIMVGYQKSIDSDRAEKQSIESLAKEVIQEAELEAFKIRRGHR